MRLCFCKQSPDPAIETTKHRTGDFLESKLMFPTPRADVGPVDAIAVKTVRESLMPSSVNGSALSTAVYTTLSSTGEVALRSPRVEPHAGLHPQHMQLASERQQEILARYAHIQPPLSARDRVRQDISHQPKTTQNPQPKITYPGESRDEFGKRICDGAKDNGLLRLVGLQVPLAVGLRVRPVDQGTFNASMHATATSRSLARGITLHLSEYAPRLRHRCMRLLLLVPLRTCVYGSESSIPCSVGALQGRCGLHYQDQQRSRRVLCEVGSD
jgi:hypothetical protein